MPPADRNPLESVARAITDGKPVDWDRLTAEHPELRSRIEQFRRIQSLADSARHVLRGGVIDSTARVDLNDTPAPTDARTAGAASPATSLFNWGTLAVLEKVGEGSYGEVFRAFDPVLQREVALKLISGPAALTEESLGHLEEARRLARVRHPNVLTVYGVEVHDGRPGMWTDFLRGETLERTIRRSDPMSADEIVVMARDLCRALAAVHDAGIVHGDVKAANVMCELDGRVILMDFGAGSHTGSSPPIETRGGKRHAVVGTPLVMAPELLAGDPPTIASDIYALGVLLYRLAAGRYPFEAKTLRLLLDRQRRRARIPLAEIRPDLPAELSQAIEQALDADPKNRFQDAVQMGNLLAAAVGHPPIGSASRGPRSRPHDLPRPRDRFIGRERELKTVRRLIVKSGVVTLVGPGGTGKTRLALQVAAEVAEAFPDGTYWIELGPLGSASDVGPSLALVLGIKEDPKRPAEDRLLERLAGRSALLVLDNCEHVLEECARLIELVRIRCPKVRFLATSRESLGVKQEERFAVPPLSLPPPLSRGGPAPALEIVAYEAVRLFIDRAHRSRAGFTLTRANASAIVDICRRVDGIPLAIELAAARAIVMEPTEIATRLAESFRVLGRTDREAERLPHQKTLETSIAWSVELLREPERTLLRRLSVFSGRWTLEAAEQVCRDPGSLEPLIEGETILDLSASLIEKSLISSESSLREDAREESRAHSEVESREDAQSLVPARTYRMLDMIRHHARARLEEAGELEAVQVLHLQYWVAHARQAARGLYSSGEAAWARRLDWEHENLLAALRWVQTIAPLHADLALQAANGIGRYWYARAVTVGRAVLEGLVALPTVSPSVRAHTLLGLAWLVQTQGDHRLVRAMCDEALGIHRAAGDENGVARALATLSEHLGVTGRYEEAVRIQEEVVEIRRKQDNLALLAGVLWNLGVRYAFAGDFRRAKASYEEALALSDRVGDVRGAAQIAANLAATALDLDDLPEAKRWGDESLRRLRSVGEGLDTTGTLRILGTVALEEGDSRTARSRILEAIPMLRERGDRRELARCMAGLACTLALDEDWERAARLWGAVEVQAETHGDFLDPGFRARAEQRISKVRSQLGENRYADLRSFGRALTLEQALTLGGASDGA